MIQLSVVQQNTNRSKKQQNTRLLQNLEKIQDFYRFFSKYAKIQDFYRITRLLQIVATLNLSAMKEDDVITFSWSSETARGPLVFKCEAEEKSNI